MPPHHKVEDLSGKKVGEYDIVGRIGAGGMGVVYEGVQPLIGKRVAVKVLLPQLSSDAELVERFLSEARAVNAIRHRGIVDIFSFGELPSGSHYFVMEYLDGEPFDQLIKVRAPIPIYDVLSWTEEVLDALDAAHSSGIIHRDIKPSNLFLVSPPRGRPYVKLLDFGVAKLGALKGEATPETRASVIIGTPDYMSPEQARGRKIGPATDLYAMGCVMFELLTGKRLFKGENPMQTMFMHVENQPPRVSELVREAPPELDDLLLWALEKDLEKRPATAAEMKQHVEAIKAIVPNEKTQSLTSLPRIVLSGGPATPGPGSGSRARLGTPAPKSTTREPKPVKATPEPAPTSAAVRQPFEADPTRIVPSATRPEVEVAPEAPALTLAQPSAVEDEEPLVIPKSPVPKLVVLGLVAFCAVMVPVAYFTLSPSKGEGRGEGQTEEKAKAEDRLFAEQKAAAEKEKAERKAAEQTAEKQTAEKQTAEKQTAEKQTAEKQTAEKQTAEKQAAEKQAAEKQAAEKQAAEKLAADKQAADKQAASIKRAAEQAAADRRAAEKKAAADKKATVAAANKPKGKVYTAEEVASRIVALEQKLVVKEAKTGGKDRVLRQFLDQAKAQASSAKTDEDRKELWGFLSDLDKQLRQ